MHNNRIADKPIGMWEHSNRPVCWIDDITVVIAYYPHEEEEEGSSNDSPHEVHFYKVDGEESVIEKKVKVPGIDIMSAKFCYSEQLKSIIAFSDKIGVVVLGLNGQILFHDPELRVDTYYPEIDRFVKTESNLISIYQITPT